MVKNNQGVGIIKTLSFYKLLRFAISMTAVITILVSVRFTVYASISDRPFKVLQSIYTAEFDIGHPRGFSFISDLQGFLVWGSDNGKMDESEVILGYGKSSEHFPLPDSVDHPKHAVYDPVNRRVLWLDQMNRRVLFSDALLPSTPSSKNLQNLALENITGIALDPTLQKLYVLDGNQLIIQVVDLLSGESVDGIHPSAEIKLSPGLISRFGLKNLVGLGINPDSQTFFSIDSQEQIIYEFGFDGEVLSKMELHIQALQNIVGLIFAPSSDQTDPPDEQSLFVLDAGNSDPSSGLLSSGQIIEVTLFPTSLPVGIVAQPSYLINTFLTNIKVWSHNSPDPSGIDYLPSLGKLIISDSEVDEMIWYNGGNVFITSTDGVLSEYHTTVSWSTEPSGVALNTETQNLFFANDDVKKITELDPGIDGVLWTPDDIKRTKTVTVDCEDIAYGNNSIFVAGGTDGEVQIFDLGVDGIISGDDGPITSFDTDSLGFSDLEGIAYNEINSTLYIISTAAADNYLGEVSLTGELLNAWSLDFMGTATNLRSGLTIAPGSSDPSANHVYIVSRGIDNDYGPGNNPYEDDGMVWEISLVDPNPATDTPTPTDTSTPTETPTPTDTATVTPTETPTPTDTATVTPTETPTPTDTATVTPTETPTPTDTATVTPTETPTPTDTATVTPTETPTPTDTATVTPTETPTPTDTATVTPTVTPTPTDTTTVTPTITPTPTDTATVTPTVTPTPTDTPTVTPTETPTPTDTATVTPSETPTPTATEVPPRVFFIYLPLIFK